MRKKDRNCLSDKKTHASLLVGFYLFVIPGFYLLALNDVNMTGVSCFFLRLIPGC